MVALRLGCGKGAGLDGDAQLRLGMQAIDSAIANIQCGRSELVLAGGVDALSRAPLLYSGCDGALVRRHDVAAHRRQKLQHFLKLRPAMRAADAGHRPDEGPDRPHWSAC